MHSTKLSQAVGKSKLFPPWKLSRMLWCRSTKEVPRCYRVSRYKREHERESVRVVNESYRRARHPVYTSVLRYCRTTRGCIFQDRDYSRPLCSSMSVCLSVYSIVSMLFLQLKIFYISLAQSLYFLSFLSINRWVWQLRSYIPVPRHVIYYVFYWSNYVSTS